MNICPIKLRRRDGALASTVHLKCHPERPSEARESRDLWERRQCAPAQISQIPPLASLGRDDKETARLRALRGRGPKGRGRRPFDSDSDSDPDSDGSSETGTVGSAAGTEDEVTTGWPRQPCRNFVLSEGAKRPSRRICAGRGKEYGRESAPRSKYRGADTDHRGALGDGNLEVVAHAHRKLGKRVAHFVFEPVTQFTELTEPGP